MCGDTKCGGGDAAATQPNTLPRRDVMSKEQNLKALALGGELVATHDFDRFR
jgi:hypothetical protein